QSGNLLTRAGLLWNLIYTAFQALAQRRPEFILVRHEDLSRDPLAAYQALYARLGLPFSPAAQARIRRASRAENPGEVSRRDIYNTNLDSQANLFNWRKR